MLKQLFLQKVGLKYPHKFSKTDYSLVPEKLSYSTLLNLSCKLHGPFQQRVSQQLVGAGCRVCAKKMVTTDMFIARSKERFGNSFTYENTVFVGKDAELSINCLVHGNILVKPVHHFKYRHGCPLCTRERFLKDRQDELVAKAKEVHKNKYGYEKVVYGNFNDKVEITCPVHGSFWRSLHQHVYFKSNCPKCSIAASRLTMDKFLQKAKRIHGDRYDYSKVTFAKSSDNATITCKLHGDFDQRVNSHLLGYGCKKCSIENLMTSRDEFIKNAIKIHGDNYGYDKVVYKGNKRVVEITCFDHGSFWLKPNAHISSRAGCPRCNESKGEQILSMLLKETGIKFEREFKIPPFKYRFDFYLPDFGIFLEFNGKQHYEPVPVFGGEDGFKNTKKRDQIKRTLVRSKGMVLISIPHYNLDVDKIKERLILGLKRVFKLWWCIDGNVCVFKDGVDAVVKLGLSSFTNLRYVELEAKKKYPNLRSLF